MPDDLADSNEDESLGRLAQFYRDRDPAFDARLRKATLAAQLVDLRREAKLTQSRLAELMGVPQSTVARLESGLTDPRWSTVDGYLQAVGASVTMTTEALAPKSAGTGAAATERLPRSATGPRERPFHRRPVGQSLLHALRRDAQRVSQLLGEAQTSKRSRPPQLQLVPVRGRRREVLVYGADGTARVDQGRVEVTLGSDVAGRGVVLIGDEVERSVVLCVDQGVARAEFTDVGPLPPEALAVVVLPDLEQLIGELGSLTRLPEEQYEETVSRVVLRLANSKDFAPSVTVLRSIADLPASPAQAVAARIAYDMGQGHPSQIIE